MGSARGRVAVTWQGEYAAVAWMSDRDQATPRLHTALKQVDPENSDASDVAGMGPGGRSMNGVPVSTVLPDGSYQLMLEELPNAPRNEMRDALSWRIRDRLDTPLEESVIELLEMPAQARAADKSSAYAIVARQTDVEKQIERVKAAGLNLDTIDLPELCMRNLAARLPQDEDGVAFLHFTDESGMLTITRQGVLYLIRHIDVGQLQLDQTPATQVRVGLIPQICLELQRSLDYYETHFDLPGISHLVVGPGRGMESLKHAVNEQLGLNVSTLDLGNMFELDQPLAEDEQKELLLAVGASLRLDAGSGWE